MKLGIDEGALNESWVQRWRERHGIKYLRPRGEKIRGRKANKSRVPLLVGCSMDGVKMPLCIGTAAKPTPPTVSECMQVMKNIAGRFIASTGKVPNAVTEVEQALLSIPQQQSKIRDFFKRISNRRKSLFPKNICSTSNLLVLFSY